MNLQGTYAVVEFANQESIASLHEAVALPVVSNESVVPFKSRLLSLRSLGTAVVPNSQTGPKCKPQATIPLNELIQRLSKEESVSFTKDVILMLHIANSLYYKAICVDGL